MQDPSNSSRPLDPGAHSAAEAQPDGSIAAPILVVDDDGANRATLRAVLEDIGEPVVCASSGTEALRCLLNQEFALILLDVLMPDLDGYETATLIRTRQKNRSIPIIFLSAGAGDPAQLFRGYSAGAVDYVIKPVAPEILRSKVSVFIELHKKILEVRRQAELERRLLAENLAVREEQLKTAVALERSEIQQSLVIQSLPMALYVARPEGGYRSRQFVGGNIDRLCGFTAGHFARRRKIWFSRIHESDAGQVLAALHSAETIGSFSAEYRWRCCDNTYRWFSDWGRIVRSKDGIAEMHGIWLDISQRRLLEQQLAHAQKIEALGQMTGGIAHDFNNMLSVILGSLEMVKPDELPDGTIRRRVDLARQAAQSCADLTRRLLGFARRQALEPISLQLAEEFGRLEPLLRRTLGNEIRIGIECQDNCLPVHLDPSQFEATVMNLAINARDAMPNGGELQIAATDQEIDEPSAAALDMRPGTYVVIKIADTGVGMSEEVRQRAFEPFFTTKGPNKGTGLGLSTIHGFVKQSGGSLTLESEPGRGTTLHLYLPALCDAPHRSSQVDESDPPAPGANQLVLVVDDDRRVLEMAAAMAREIGYRTLQASDAGEAMALLETEGDISLVFSDCMMDGTLDGVGLARELRQRRPDLPVLLTSGHADAFDLDSVRSPLCRFLAKPYSADQLASALTQLVRERPDS